MLHDHNAITTSYASKRMAILKLTEDDIDHVIRTCNDKHDGEVFIEHKAMILDGRTVVVLANDSKVVDVMLDE